MRILTQPDVTPHVREQWTDFISNHPSGNAFQTPDMLDFFQQVENFKPFVAIAVGDDQKIYGSLLGVVIREYSGFLGKLSARAVIYGGPLVDENNAHPDDVVRQLLESLITQTHHKCIFLQFRNFFSLDRYRETFQELNFTFRDRLNFVVSITEEQEVWKKISESKRRQIRQAIKAGAEIIIPESLDEVQDFYLLLKYLYEKKVKKPLPKWSFFKAFYDASRQQKLGKILLIKYKGQIIGGILSPIFKGRVIYEWYVCGLDREFRYLHPSVMATWAPMDFAIRNNIGSFDFMGVGTPTKDYGVREFKSKFGGEMVNFGRYTRINNQVIYHLAEFFYNILALFHKV
ncbi:MAG: aminoacyltransferase [Bacteroidetes bacterium]|nr:aminoacyltransferase [Bacteroidota bacterium]